MPVHDELGKRMRTFYEEIPKTRLMRRVPEKLGRLKKEIYKN